MAAEDQFRAMGSDAHLIIVGGPPDLLEQARRRIDHLERLWSRFLPDSEISQLNLANGDPLHVSAETVELIQRALEAWRLSGGAFDPTVLGAMLRAGYVRSFDELGEHPPSGQSVLGIGTQDIRIEGRTVRLPPGVGFDPGGIGKGLAADLVSAEAIAGGASGVCVNLGGDVRVRGTGPTTAGTWTVAIEHPWMEEPLLLIGLTEGAVATSTTLRRRWRTDGEPRHHLIDPQTGQASTTDINLATVVSAQAWAAEVLAKAVVLAGSAHPFDILGGTGAEALAVADDGFVHTTAGLAHYLGGAKPPVAIQARDLTN